MSTISGIKGFLGTSLIDFPGKVSAVVFLSGCNMRCDFCHNHLLIDQDQQLQDMPLEELMDALSRRKKLLDAIVVTGGEPTIHRQIKHLLRYLKETGLEIKLDTNGLRPNTLAKIIEQQLVDYIALDMKMAPRRYAHELHTLPDAQARLIKSVALLRDSGLAHEFRTTCVPGLVTEEDIYTIANLIQGAPAYYLQQYVPVANGVSDQSGRPPYPREVLERFKLLAEKVVDHVYLRNL